MLQNDLTTVSADLNAWRESNMDCAMHQLIRPETDQDKQAAFRCGSLVALCGIALLLGCDMGPKRVPVAGKVVIDGEPLTMGTIRFVPDTGRAVSASLMEDGSFRVLTKVPSNGSYEVEGLFPGKYKLAVFASENVSAAENSEVRWLAPPRYADFRTAGLDANIEGPSEDMVVQLTWAGSKVEPDSNTKDAQQRTANFGAEDTGE
ncbi:MAG: hypothetical protein AB7G28_21565 [Pirellulales bacterium]